MEENIVKEKYRYYLVIAFNEKDKVVDYHEEYAMSPGHAKQLANSTHSRLFCTVRGVLAFPSDT